MDETEHRHHHTALEHRVSRIEFGIAMLIFMIPIAVSVTVGVAAILK